MNKDVRWRQRFENLRNAFSEFEEASTKNGLTKLERSGLIQTFNFTFELCWKTLKDYLESKGVVEKFPRDVLKTSFQHQLIEDGHMWIEMLDKRNELAHVYNEAAAIHAEQIIKNNYYPEMKKLFINLVKKYEN